MTLRFLTPAPTSESAPLSRTLILCDECGNVMPTPEDPLAAAHITCPCGRSEPVDLKAIDPRTCAAELERLT